MINDRTVSQPMLPPLLDEFRAALQDEIEVAKRNSSNSAVPLSNGHKVANQGSAHQYAFQIDSVLNTPDGAPGDLIVPGKSPLAATIVAVEGLRIVVSVESDLGNYVPNARLQTNLTILMRKLIERIENNATAQNPAADRMLGNAPVTGTPRPASAELNESQLDALHSALGRNLTVIWGPPGTGKTYTIGTITEHLHKDSCSVLLVSHTNTAVDQAIKHVAKSLNDELQEGAVIRIGEVRDEVLSNDYPDVLLKTQVERHSRELVEEREELVEQRQLHSDRISTVQRSISIIEWLESANQEIFSIDSLFGEIENLRREEQNAMRDLSVLEAQHAQLLKLHETTAEVLSLSKLLLSSREDQKRLQSEIKSATDQGEQLSRKIIESQTRIEIAARIEPLRKERCAYPAPSEQRATITQLSGKLTAAEQGLSRIQKEYDLARSVLAESQKSGAISRTFKRLPKPAEQLVVVNSLKRQTTDLDVEIMATREAIKAATSKLARIIEIDGELSRHEDIGSYSHEKELNKQAEHRLKQVEGRISELNKPLNEIKWEMEKIEAEIDGLSQSFDGDAKDVYIQTCSKLQKYKELQRISGSFSEKITDIQRAVDTKLTRLVVTVQQWLDLGDVPTATREVLNQIRLVYADLSAQYATTNLAALTTEIYELTTEVKKLTPQIAEIDGKLAEVEHEVIAKASVIGATLTKTYLSDDIQSRKFDTVILDEASMAPIPALWAAALLAERNLILVGDFKQLPPIVLSNNELTRKWLGRDVFEVSGLREQWENEESPSHFIALKEQRRMLPEIAKVANQFYNGLLSNAFEEPKQYQDFPRFQKWYAKDWPQDNPVILVDTGPLNAWVTSVVKRGNSSRLNFLSATVAVDLSEQLLSTDRPERNEGDAKRILIVSPYRAHAKLVSILIKDFAKLENDVVAGTAHSFQGSEADVVIFDMVVDEPHFRVNLFMPSLDEELKCLLNVALTRAKFRLIVLGDFDYCLKLGKKAFLGRSLLPFLLEQFPRIDARNIVPDGLAARAAKAQMSTMGGEIEPNTDRIVVTQVDFYRVLSSDLSRAHQRVIIYSPFITTDRLAFLLPQLQAAIQRGVSIFVITKAHSERSKSELTTIKKIETQLSESGIVLIHKLRMHEKLVFIDDDITWAGSLNPLSFSNTQEVMERRKSKAVLKDYFQILRLQELLGIQGTNESKCPICGKEIIAAEGADQPYYWRCVDDDCFSRSIDQPYPLNGILQCSNCNSPVEYGDWGGVPHWRCTSNPRHRQKVFKSHLRLPKMAALVPKGERKKLCRLLHIENFDALVSHPSSSSKPSHAQGTLFD